MSRPRFLSRRVRPWVAWMAVGGGVFGLITLAPILLRLYFDVPWSNVEGFLYFPGLIVSWGMTHGDSGTPYEKGRDTIVAAMMINTFAGALLAGAARGVVVLKRRIRRRMRRGRNQCLACGYSLRGLAHRMCPECGGADL